MVLHLRGECLSKIRFLHTMDDVFEGSSFAYGASNMGDYYLAC
jgi:hypothetical protein